MMQPMMYSYQPFDVAGSVVTTDGVTQLSYLRVMRLKLKGTDVQEATAMVKKTCFCWPPFFVTFPLTKPIH